MKSKITHFTFKQGKVESVTRSLLLIRRGLKRYAIFKFFFLVKSSLQIYRGLYLFR